MRMQRTVGVLAMAGALAMAAPVWAQDSGDAEGGVSLGGAQTGGGEGEIGGVPLDSPAEGRVGGRNVPPDAARDEDAEAEGGTSLGGAQTGGGQGEIGGVPLDSPAEGAGRGRPGTDGSDWPAGDPGG